MCFYYFYRRLREWVWRKTHQYRIVSLNEKLNSNVEFNSQLYQQTDIERGRLNIKSKEEEKKVKFTIEKDDIIKTLDDNVSVYSDETFHTCNSNI